MSIEKVEKILLQIKEVYKYHSTGGLLHIVLDDGNLSKSDIKFCIRLIKKSEEIFEIKQMYLDCAKSLLKLKLKQRKEIYNYMWSNQAIRMTEEEALAELERRNKNSTI